MSKTPNIIPKNGNSQPTSQEPAALFSSISNLTDKEIQLLCEILSIPNKSEHEWLLAKFIKCYCKYKGYKTSSDKMGNVYVVKGRIEDDEFMPLLNAHLDSVFTEHLELLSTNQRIDIKINMDTITGYHPSTGNQMGVGMDDKNGVFILLMVLDKIEKGKAVFTVQEEIGMRGAEYSINRKDVSFYKGIGYLLSFDSPNNNIFSESFNGKAIFNRDSDYFKIAEPFINKHLDNPVYASHPWTCFVKLQELLGLQGFNLPSAYFNYHRESEYGSFSGISTTINMAVELIEKLGNKIYKL